jgi:glycosyltransferase involved in cell wall biosynthesis
LTETSLRVAVVIPCFRVRRHILDVLKEIPEAVHQIYVVDDACPDNSGLFVSQNTSDPRIKVMTNPVNLGVGGAVMNGYRAAMSHGADIVVKIDGDGQMDPSLIPLFIEPIALERADYTKGNRFFDLEQIVQMPTLRIIGNAGLSFLSKLSTGYWKIFDPTNGYTAIHARVIAKLPLNKISNRYFFESDILFRLNCLRAVVEDVPMHAKYADEESHLKIAKIFNEFLFKHARNGFKRIFYNYFLRDISAASVELVAGILLFSFGLFFGIYAWSRSAHGELASSGTVMLAALPTLLGIQFIIAFVNLDIVNQPGLSLWPRLKSLSGHSRGGTDIR